MKTPSHYTLYILMISAVLAACSQKKDETRQAPTPPARKIVMDVPSGTKAPAVDPVDTIPGQTKIKITCQCLATTDPDMLDIMPRNIRSVRRDSTILDKINSGEVYVVKPGESGYILQKQGNRLQLRFPDKIAWVMASDTK